MLSCRAQPSSYLRAHACSRIHPYPGISCAFRTVPIRSRRAQPVSIGQPRMLTCAMLSRATCARALPSSSCRNRHPARRRRRRPPRARARTELPRAYRARALPHRHLVIRRHPLAHASVRPGSSSYAHTASGLRIVAPACARIVSARAHATDATVSRRLSELTARRASIAHRIA